MVSLYSNKTIHTLEARRSRRLAIVSCGEVVLREGPVACKMIDVSQHGARLAIRCRSSEGDYGLLRCEGLDILFRIMRVAEDEIGIEFVDETSELDDENEDDLDDFSRVVNNYQILRLLDHHS